MKIGTVFDLDWALLDAAKIGKVACQVLADESAGIDLKTSRAWQRKANKINKIVLAWEDQQGGEG